MRSLRKALVVGGTGFLGSWLVERLAVDGVEAVVADANDFDLEDADAVFQVSGTGVVPVSIEAPLDDLSRNTATTLAVLEAARRAERRPLVCFVSSAAVYGESRRLVMDESHPLEPISPYGISKLAAERYVSLYAAMHELQTFSVRPFSLYGPRQRKLVVYDLLARLLDGEDPLLVMSSAEVTRDFVFVEDAAAAIVTLAQKARARGEAYNIATGRPTALGDLVAELVRACGLRTEVRFTGVTRPGDPVRWYGDATRAQKLGASFDTPLREGLRRTAAWLAETRTAHAVA